MRRQRGLSFWGFLFVGVLAALALLVGFKVTPSVVEYYGIKKAITTVAGEATPGTTVTDIRNAFMRRQAIDDFSSVDGKDLDISKDGGDVVISVAYDKKIPLFANVSLLIEYEATSGKSKAKRVE
ncbi:MAG TPA: DUF4845 domain-containing protein [Rhodocyclaceae bacterium]|nr:DUF4845 domain-containing protein [Rhodocyclaceae bacterium]HMV53984.1 DUF4845 domain-containing protein [Rhodocyclaceae bacterium]HNB79042.1 DUF4845 domain-containing protein [Rhodocyclaceae bacterium]HNH13854.1 DUF4845 domain-containing protein [Rhodocyclaceae bacterium]HNH99663.1 DUF4845 domain-containing protein [Rhodocyclaceae bacterium]